MAGDFISRREAMSSITSGVAEAVSASTGTVGNICLSVAIRRYEGRKS
jgi:hypothetical protein